MKCTRVLKIPWGRINACGNGTASITSGKKVSAVHRPFWLVASVLAVVLLYASLTAYLPMTGLEGLLLLVLLITLAVVRTGRRRLVPQGLARRRPPGPGGATAERPAR